MNHMMEQIVQEAITTKDPHIMGVSTIVDAEDEENAEGTSNVDHRSATPYTIHTAVLPKPSLIDANVNSSINAMWKIVQLEDTNTNDNDRFDEALPSYDHGSCRPVILVSHESNEPIVEWIDNTKLLSGTFPDKFLFDQGVPKGLPTEQNWNHFALYYDGQFDDPLFIAHGFNQLQHASCFRSSARITGKNAARLKSLGELANSEAFCRQLIWARGHPYSKETKSFNAKVCWILSMVGLGILYSLFERAATQPKLNAMQFHCGVGSNFITGAPPKFEDMLTLPLCMNPKFNKSNFHISKQGFKQVNLPDQMCNETAVHMRMTKLCPLLEAQNFHHKLSILLEAVIGCKSSLDTRRSHDYLQNERCAYHCIAAFRGVIKPQQDGRLHWHIMLYLSVLSPELLEKGSCCTYETADTGC
jgi:hypothetical protein